MRFGFIYLWHDRTKKKYYLGSHLGLPNDGYVGSNNHLLKAYRKRPDSFKRRILESHVNINSKDLLYREQLWLDLIKPEELQKKYYNQKKVAAGGDIISFLTEEQKRQHSKKSGLASKKFWDNITKEELNKRKINAFGGNKFSRDYLRERNKINCSKQALVKFPNGIEKIIKNIAEFCRENNLNYGNFKTVLRGNGKHKSCRGFKGKYL
jgi:hypothetical protein